MFAAPWYIGSRGRLELYCWSATRCGVAALYSQQICLLLLCLKTASAVVLLLESLKQGSTDVVPLLQCNTWQAPPDSGFSRVECWPMDFDDPDKYLENMSQLQSLNVLVSTRLAHGPLLACLHVGVSSRLGAPKVSPLLQIGMHGAGLINHNFMRPNAAFVEIVPCMFGGPWHDNSFQTPARMENVQFAFKIQCYNQDYCWPSELERADRRPGKAWILLKVLAKPTMHRQLQSICLMSIPAADHFDADL